MLNYKLPIWPDALWFKVFYGLKIYFTCPKIFSVALSMNICVDQLTILKFKVIFTFLDIVLLFWLEKYFRKTIFYMRFMLTFFNQYFQIFALFNAYFISFSTTGIFAVRMKTVNITLVWMQMLFWQIQGLWKFWLNKTGTIYDSMSVYF